MREIGFTVTEDHLKLVRSFYVDFDSSCEFGAPAVDPKRPYGNSFVYGDIAEILGIKAENPEDGTDFSDKQRADMHALHRETATVLQIAIDTGVFEPGEYRKAEYGGRWKRAR